jgi:hypothetical protein
MISFGSDRLSEHGNEPPGSTKCGEFDYLTDYKLHNDTSPSSYLVSLAQFNSPEVLENSNFYSYFTSIYYVCLSIYVSISMTLQPSAGPWPLLQFLNPKHSWQDSLERGSARRNASSYTQNINTE